MTALVIATGQPDSSVPSEPLATALGSMTAQGFATPRQFSAGATDVFWFQSLADPGSESRWLQLEDGFVVVAGFLAYRGEHGSQALQRLWQDFENPQALAADDLYGNFALVIAKAGRVWLITDQLGLLRVFRSSDGSLLSTSWLACATAAPVKTVNRLAAAEYVLCGANHGNRSPINEVGILPPGLHLDLVTGERQGLASSGQWLSHPEYSSFGRAVEDVSELIVSRFSQNLGSLPSGLVSAISAGFDSRLILAGLQASNRLPELFTYGHEQDVDVRIGQTVARHLQVPHQRIDKSQLAIPGAESGSARYQRNLQAFDATPIDGLLDNGGDEASRRMFTDLGHLQLNGGGGEILRNFFYLRDRQFTAEEICRVFYHQFPTRAFLHSHDYDAYMDMLAQSIRDELAVNGLLSRREVELIYPLFRVRYWTSRTNGIASRFGLFATPLVDPPLVRCALAIPLSWKRSGRFEAALIARLSTELGAIPMSYGFSPLHGPTFGVRLKSVLQEARPPFLRQHAANMRNWSNRRKQSANHSESLSGATELGSILNFDHLDSDMQRTRARSLEFVFKRLGV